MRILFVNRYFWPDHSATSQLLGDLAFHLAEQGHEVAVIASRQRYDAPDARLEPWAQERGVTIHRVRTTRFGRGGLLGRAVDYLSFYLTAARWLARLAGSGDVVVVKTDPPLFCLVAGVLSKLKGFRLVNWLQDVYPEVAQALGVPVAGGAVGRTLRRLRNAVLRGSAANVVLGARMAEHLAREGLDASRIAVIHNWSDEDTVRPVPPESNRLRTDWGLADRFVVGYSGNLGRAHESETLLAVAERLAHRQDIRFLMVGGGSGMDWLQAEVARRNLSNFVFKPYQPRARLAKSLSVADVHWLSLNPSMEGLIVPSKFYGIAAAGRPAIMVGDADGEVARLLAVNGCGVTVPVGGAEAFAAAVAAFADDPVRTRAMGLRARRLFEQRFTRREALARWDALLARTAAEPATLQPKEAA